MACLQKSHLIPQDVFARYTWGMRPMDAALQIPVSEKTQGKNKHRVSYERKRSRSKVQEWVSPRAYIKVHGRDAVLESVAQVTKKARGMT